MSGVLNLGHALEGVRTKGIASRSVDMWDRFPLANYSGRCGKDRRIAGRASLAGQSGAFRAPVEKCDAIVRVFEVAGMSAAR